MQSRSRGMSRPQWNLQLGRGGFHDDGALHPWSCSPDEPLCTGSNPVHASIFMPRQTSPTAGSSGSPRTPIRLRSAYLVPPAPLLIWTHPHFSTDIFIHSMLLALSLFHLHPLHHLFFQPGVYPYAFSGYNLQRSTSTLAPMPVVHSVARMVAVFPFHGFRDRTLSGTGELPAIAPLRDSPFPAVLPITTGGALGCSHGIH